MFPFGLRKETEAFVSSLPDNSVSSYVYKHRIVKAIFRLRTPVYSGTSLFRTYSDIKKKKKKKKKKWRMGAKGEVLNNLLLGHINIEVSSFQGVGIEGSTVYRGVLISRCWNRGVPLYTEVSSFQGVEIEGFHCIQRCPHFRELE